MDKGRGGQHAKRDELTAVSSLSEPTDPTTSSRVPSVTRMPKRSIVRIAENETSATVHLVPQGVDAPMTQRLGRMAGRSRTTGRDERGGDTPRTPQPPEGRPTAGPGRTSRASSQHAGGAHVQAYRDASASPQRLVIRCGGFQWLDGRGVGQKQLTDQPSGLSLLRPTPRSSNKSLGGETPPKRVPQN